MYQMNRDEGNTTHNKEYAETKVSHFVCVLKSIIFHVIYRPKTHLYIFHCMKWTPNGTKWTHTHTHTYESNV